MTIYNNLVFIFIVIEVLIDVFFAIYFLNKYWKMKLTDLLYSTLVYIGLISSGTLFIFYSYQTHDLIRGFYGTAVTYPLITIIFLLLILINTNILPFKSLYWEFIFIIITLCGLVLSYISLFLGIEQLYDYSMLILLFLSVCCSIGYILLASRKNIFSLYLISLGLAIKLIFTLLLLFFPGSENLYYLYGISGILYALFLGLGLFSIMNMQNEVL